MAEIVWLRRDLRLHDHPPLAAALRSGDPVLPVFCFDERLWNGRHRSGPRTQFLLESLGDLDESLRARGSRLIIRQGPPERELPALAGQAGATKVHTSADAGPFARRREDRVQRALREQGAELCRHPGVFTADDPAAVRTQSGGPYTVFTPYFRTWLRASRRNVVPAPGELPPIPNRIAVGRLPRLRDLGLQAEVEHPPAGGERAARARAGAFLKRAVHDYGERRNRMDLDGSSRLSPYLHFGCLSARELERRLPDSAGAAEFRRQLCWRDFYAQVIQSFPANARSEYQDRYRGSLRWSRARQAFDAWCEGRTGYPLVDAAMRQLRREGWMHNRARLVAGSFLTKDLGIDWRWGERWFMRLLVDGDEASNNGNWQWIASVGVDPQPPARRIYNPSRQQASYDPHGAYVRRYVPELAHVPDGYLAEPWTMPDDVQGQARCVVGRDYPAPIVDHLRARREAIERYTAAR